VPLSLPPRDAHGKVIPHDHSGIGSADGIIRRIPEHWIVKEADGRRRLSSLAFSPSSGPNGGMSVDLQAQIEEGGLNCRDYITGTSPVSLGSIRFEAGALRGAGLQVGFNPMPSNPHHGLTITHNSRELRERSKGQVVDNKKGATDNKLF